MQSLLTGRPHQSLFSNSNYIIWFFLQENKGLLFRVGQEFNQIGGTAKHSLCQQKLLAQEC